MSDLLAAQHEGRTARRDGRDTAAAAAAASAAAASAAAASAASAAAIGAASVAVGHGGELFSKETMEPSHSNVHSVSARRRWRRMRG